MKLAADHPVKRAANASINAADEAIKAARAFAATLGNGATKITSNTSIKASVTATTNNNNNNNSNNDDDDDDDDKSIKICESKHSFPGGSVNVIVSGRSMSSRLYKRNDILNASKKLISKYTNKKKNGMPNIRWRAITDAVLELHPRYVALPDPTEIKFETLADLSKFRQSSWQSQELHKCRITTRHLVDALGLSLSPRMSLSKKSTKSDSMKYLRRHLAGQRPTSYGYLCRTTMNTRDIVLRTFASDECIPKCARWNIESKEQPHPDKVGYSIISSQAEPLLGIQICFGQPIVGERLIIYANSADTKVKYWKLQSNSKYHKNNEFHLIGCGRSNNFCAGVVVSDESCESGQMEGIQVVMIEENPSAMSEKEFEFFCQNTTWQYNENDGTLKHVHTQLFLSIDINVQKSKNCDAVWTAIPSSKMQHNEAQGLSSWTHELRQQLPENIARSQDRLIPKSFRNSKDVAMAWGGVQEATAVLALMNEFPNSCVHEIGCALLESAGGRIPLSWGIDIRDLPLIGASPDALLVHSDGTKEVVEIKNICPFVDSKRGVGSSGKSSNTKSFEIGNNKTPPMQIPASHMPQIQMEMLCTDTQVNNYVVASAFHGIHLFRVQRNDEYIKLMLELLRNLELEIIRKIVPERSLDVSFFESDSRYERFHAFSIQLVEKIPLWRQIHPTRVQRSDEEDIWSQ
jgi:hypothetical protein